MGRGVDYSQRNFPEWPECQSDQWADGQPLCPQGRWSAFGRYSWSARSGRTDAGSIAYRYAG